MRGSLTVRVCWFSCLSLGVCVRLCVVLLSCVCVFCTNFCPGFWIHEWHQRSIDDARAQQEQETTHIVTQELEKVWFVYWHQLVLMPRDVLSDSVA